MHGLSRRYVLAGSALTIAGAAAWRPVAAEEPPLAIKGYDPVAYFTIGKATPGLPAFEHRWDEHRYRFASAAHRDLFAADPVRYAPQFANYCAMALSMGKVVEADPEAWIVRDGRLYVFGMAVGADLFMRDPATIAEKANANRRLIEK